MSNAGILRRLDPCPRTCKMKKELLMHLHTGLLGMLNARCNEAEEQVALKETAKWQRWSPRSGRGSPSWRCRRRRWVG